MPRVNNEAPRQDTAKFEAKDQKLQALGSGKQLAPVKACNDWTLKVNVTGMVGARKAKLDSAAVEVDWTDGTLDAPLCQMTPPDKGTTTALVGSGPRSGTCSATAKGWYLDAEKDVSLADGDDKQVDLVLKPAVWIAFSVVDHKSSAFIGDVRLKANLPQLGDHLASTPADAVLDIEHDELRPAMTCTMLELSHDDIVYEVVGAITSA